MEYSMLVNRDNKVINSEEIINNLVKVDIRSVAHIDSNYECFVNDEAYFAFLKMQKDALDNGFDIDIDSGYRSEEYQRVVLDYWIGKKGDIAYETVLEPGHSEHQTGLAIDVCCFKDGEYICIEDDSHNEIKWVMNNCHKYGFIHRYPIDKIEITKVDYEPWHIRYVGLELSMYLYSNDLVLEQWHNLDKKN